MKTKILLALALLVWTIALEISEFVTVPLLYFVSGGGLIMATLCHYNYMVKYQRTMEKK